MKRLTSSLLIVAIALITLPGCSDTATVKQETKTTTPGGSTSVSVEKTVKTTGDNPPPAK